MTLMYVHDRVTLRWSTVHAYTEVPIHSYLCKYQTERINFTQEFMGAYIGLTLNA